MNGGRNEGWMDGGREGSELALPAGDRKWSDEEERGRSEDTFTRHPRREHVSQGARPCSPLYTRVHAHTSCESVDS